MIVPVLLVLAACADGRDAGPPGAGPSSAPPTATTPSPAVTPTPSPTPTPTRTPTPTPAPTETDDGEDKKDGDGRRGKGRKRDGGNGSSKDKPAARVLRRGDEGQAVRKLQRKLANLRYWVGPADGVYGLLTEQAVMALQGAEGLQRDGIFGPKTRRAMRNASPARPRDRSGNHIEIDESRGILIIVRGGSARWVFHTSTGTEEPYEHPSGETYVADTPNGRWTFSWQVDGWRDGRLGRMWRPKYFHEDGIAIHGYPEVPAYPASHGCARVTMDAIDFIWEQGLAPMGSDVVVYGRG